ncbi:MAG: hypothetical protein U5K69_22070 [Balneolaceae bacterium]|nr:hypothetical protein [Balneolaceae bacterium]
MVSFTPNGDSLISGIETINEDISEDVSTNLNGAVIQGLSVMDARLQEIRQDSDIATAGSMVLFTDGTNQAEELQVKTTLTRSTNIANTKTSVFQISIRGEIDQEYSRVSGKMDLNWLRTRSNSIHPSFAMARRLEAK